MNYQLSERKFNQYRAVYLDYMEDHQKNGCSQMEYSEKTGIEIWTLCRIIRLARVEGINFKRPYVQKRVSEASIDKQSSDFRLHKSVSGLKMTFLEVLV